MFRFDRFLARAAILLTVPGLAQPSALAQDLPDSVRVVLPGIRVEAARGTYSQSEAPAAVSVLDVSDLRRGSEPLLALENMLSELPGIWLSDRNHLALGERIVIRGLGSRAAFGVRSVAVLLDGVLLTMPDGQAVLDPVEPAMIRRAEVIRGPASRFWGNASGGVLSLDSGSGRPDSSGGRIRMMAGSLGEQQVLAEASLSGQRHRTSFWASRLDLDGYREHAAGTMGRLGLRSQLPFRHALITLSVHASHLDTQAPGSLTRDQWASTPKAADTRYVSTQSGKVATQVQGSIGATAALAGGVLSSSLFAVSRSLDNPLPFGWVGVERTASGARLDWQRERHALRIGLGADARLQSDDRLNADNAGGRRGSDTRLDQNETVSGLGASALVGYQLTADVLLSAGLRLDGLRVELDDRFLSDGDQSGSESFLAYSPSIGVSRQFGSVRAFAAWSSAFEIPTTTELVDSPDGLTGFNTNLKPQKITGFEGGLRRAAANVDLDLAVYTQRLTNFLSPYQLEDFPGRNFYRNVGSVEYVGLELGIRIRPMGSLEVDASASIHQYRFASGELDGQTVPGVPMQFGSVRVAYAMASLTPSVRVRWAASQWADDANTDTVDGFVVTDLRVAHTGFRLARTEAFPFVEVSNVTDTNYASSVVVNARGGRYYDANPGRAIRAGLSIAF